MSGNLTVPNTLFGLPSGPQPLSVIDDDFTAISSYINTREVTFDTLANRPAAGTSGRYYFATDTGSFYADNGTAWVALSSAAGGTGASPLAGSLAQTSVYLTDDTFSLDAVACNLIVPGTGQVFTVNPVPQITNTRTVVGVNGRDQAGALSADSWGHLYWIYNPTTVTLATLLSAAAWPGSLPTLPSGYTALCYAGAVRMGAAGVYSVMAIRARRTYWGTRVTALAAGTSATKAAFSTATGVPPNALEVQGTLFMRSTTDPGGQRFVKGELFYTTVLATLTGAGVSYSISSATDQGSAAAPFSLANIGQSLTYWVTDLADAAVAGTNQLTCYITSFDNPSNG